ncbi:NADH-FMN oxidoreductase RutF, flavin reductase (DIM6/NTAB) family [Halopenitus malekzadehii]|uniref:NADH-FMN oxidoreductase RutF, flavin reductase (DIM6/NTAB) family n=1 Tax=Halopenitus malekzadehii TaxID=1267564 RepID=A0A1H6I2X2_9EURY|nr:flavin reductase family protein [Halopenitus malekzadehii]SEH42431.1 NADH-FMN oxidoreductase RutF, flavin reductase (DIM6/NTAB) family [Halopenitus malekzadehii]
MADGDASGRIDADTDGTDETDGTDGTDDAETDADTTRRVRGGDPDAFGSPYRLLSGSVGPRPIAWVSSRGSAGENLAPYSFFTVAAVDPPVLLFAPVATRAAPKDSLANALETEAFAINVVTHDLVTAMNETAATLPRGESEFDRAGVTPVECDRIDAPRVAEVAVSFECTLYDTVDVGGSTLVLGEVVYAHVDEAVTTDGKLDVRKLDVVGRLAGNWYAETGDRFEIERPP